MRHQGFSKEWARAAEEQWRQHGGHGRSRGRGRGERGGAGPWSGFGYASSSRQGPPPWVAEMFGIGRADRSRSPRVRRGDVRSAILDVLRAAAATREPLNGYQVIQQIAERSDGAWRPSPGSVYPTVQQLQDEGLIESDGLRSRRTLSLTEAGAAYVAQHADELDAVWAPFERSASQDAEHADIKPEIGQVMGAVWQIVTTGSDQQRRAAIEVLIDARRKLYGILADGDPADGDPADDDPADDDTTAHES